MESGGVLARFSALGLLAIAAYLFLEFPREAARPVPRLQADRKVEAGSRRPGAGIDRERLTAMMREL
ncbi:MAG: hypothetical protein HY925_16255, partial [Elusimicrobia bacterium]|nr:hypothetical protein [Elusimicrobiota bacterium]